MDLKRSKKLKGGILYTLTLNFRLRLKKLQKCFVYGFFIIKDYELK